MRRFLNQKILKTTNRSRCLSVSGRADWPPSLTCTGSNTPVTSMTLFVLSLVARDMFVSCSCHVRVMFVSCSCHVRVMFVSCSCHVRDMFVTCSGRIV